MKLQLNRTSSNNLYTHGVLRVNGSLQTSTVEHTFSMLLPGKYNIMPVIDKKGNKEIIIYKKTPCRPLCRILAGNSWVDSLAHHCILVGILNIPGTVISSRQAFGDLFEKLSATNERITLVISDENCIENNPARFWNAPRHHYCPPSHQYVKKNRNDNITIFYNDGSTKFLPAPVKEEA